VVCIHIPRHAYLKHFAHNESGQYIGTERQREWTEKELELEFGEFWEEGRKPRKWVRRGTSVEGWMVEANDDEGKQEGETYRDRSKRRKAKKDR
jgi:hypothetical protein